MIPYPISGTLTDLISFEIWKFGSIFLDTVFRLPMCLKVSAEEKNRNRIKNQINDISFLSEFCLMKSFNHCMVLVQTNFLFFVVFFPLFGYEWSGLLSVVFWNVIVSSRTQQAPKERSDATQPKHYGGVGWGDRKLVLTNHIQWFKYV